MAKPTGFLEYDREPRPKRPVEVRTHDWREYEIPHESPALRTQAARCMDCGVPFCHQGCPLGNLVPDWNDLVYRDRWREAIDRLHATNNFPEFTGRVCPAPCEQSCVLNLRDAPVAIKAIEEAIVDRAWDEGWVVPEVCAVRSGKRVAVVGSGPAGLACAQQLARAGHDVTVLERDERIGGLLRYGIPDFKMEKWRIDRRLAQMEGEGVAFRTGVHVGVGRDVTLDALRGEYDAVCLATGACVPRELPVPGRALRGVHFAMDYLAQRNRIVHGASVPDAISAKGKRVVILGGGDTGADCLGSVHREGCASVVQIELMARPPIARSAEIPWPWWPLVLRTSAAHEEGGARDWAIRTTALRDDGTGHVSALEATRVSWGTDADGRRVMVDEPGGALAMECDLVLLAMGFTGAEDIGHAIDPRGNLAADEVGRTTVPGVFACGDARRGQSLVVWAIAEGRTVAREIDAYLGTLATVSGTATA